MPPARPKRDSGFALSADLVSSRKTKNRVELSGRIERAIAGVNARYDREWIAPLRSVKGIDELSGFMVSPRHVLDVLFEVNRDIWPAAFRLGVGFGTIDVGIGSRDSSDLDGPAFARAAEAVRRAKREGKPVAFDVPGWEPPPCRLLEESARLASILMRESWTQARIRVMEAYERLGNQQAAGKELGISQQSVSEALRGGHHEAITSMLGAVREWLQGSPSQREGSGGRGSLSLDHGPNT